MGAYSKIQWTTHTFNPWRGCTKVSEGCKVCYAERSSKRNPKVMGTWGNNGTRVVASEAMWAQPLKWQKEAEESGKRPRVFCASLADIWEARAELNAPRIRLFETIDRTPGLDWLLLTKRPENWQPFSQLAIDADGRAWGEVKPSRRDHVRPNLWNGTSVEDQANADIRIDHLMRIPSVIRFLSIEPILGPVSLDRWLGWHLGEPEQIGQIHWVIVGGESGAQARPCDLDWLRSLRDQCEAAGVSFFCKQLGRRPIDRGREIRLADSHGGDWDEWPDESLKIRELPV